MEHSRLSKKERHELILSEVRRSASIRISRLAIRLGVAGETIRRDLIELGDAGLLNRTYGGATISLVTSEPVIAERSQTMVEERTRIGRGAAGLVKKGQIVMIDGGSTTYEVARNLSQLRRDLTVITNSIGVASVAGANPTFRVVLCPGTYDSREASVFGEDTVEFIRRYNADIAIIGASSLSADGPSDMISGAAAVKRAMISRTLSTALVVTNDKFGRNSLERVCGLGELSDIVTDREPQPALRAVIEAGGTELHVFGGG
ncbi:MULTISPECIES: DeoR/GlpR family DNA-binding transcription regulator [Mesorhizobium]|jgi:DeoR family transcriptional regulator, glycerol-3-phosphate regulon repressor|uniref:Transcriptional regulator /DeoR family transcriptional regulator n=1 Tax=Rhizobium loti TaxID=381 RepID=A0A8E2WFD1_RHILI|nr:MULTISPECIES: DeoR/GlpR family DNA-binding transcription regulator [Mesorhizobium]PWJ93418.1 transcriptional regulator /DeoR family transcriptional regulator [Mesorhizobium loti]RUX90259.1 DeoR/GlpR transcriptional regulator [Mesorhizobium sp. M7D.F.Ca.US.004.01.2.1]RVA22143.1 DeoR/GlpR transcriptional regulator [Mesorhizobium sp. M7D.F.Ca.US.004.03.1.1]